MGQQGAIVYRVCRQQGYMLIAVLQAEQASATDAISLHKNAAPKLINPRREPVFAYSKLRPIKNGGAIGTCSSEKSGRFCPLIYRPVGREGVYAVNSNGVGCVLNLYASLPRYE